ncbi:MAG TPA: universal stress protein [Acidimicrobiales bacterium]|jgi:nucleotide-binding universal stress UspA family protein
MENRIVVGVTAAERQAQLTWAVDESLKWNAPLLIVHCCADRYQIEVPDPDEEEVRAARAVLEIACDTAQALGVKADTLLGDGFPGEALVEASRDASQLVVGTSHRSRLSHAQHASVSTYCVRHAHCPVTIVPVAS